MTLSIGSLHPNHGGLAIFYGAVSITESWRSQGDCPFFSLLELGCSLLPLMLSRSQQKWATKLIFLSIEIITHFLMFEHTLNYLSFTYSPFLGERPCLYCLLHKENQFSDVSLIINANNRTSFMMVLLPRAFHFFIIKGIRSYYWVWVTVSIMGRFFWGILLLLFKFLPTFKTERNVVQSDLIRTWTENWTQAG